MYDHKSDLGHCNFVLYFEDSLMHMPYMEY